MTLLSNPNRLVRYVTPLPHLLKKKLKRRKVSFHNIKHIKECHTHHNTIEITYFTNKIYKLYNFSDLKGASAITLSLPSS